MSTYPQPDSSLFDLYLDNLLSDVDRRRVERSISSSQRLLAEAQLQRRIDDSLLRVFAPRSAPDSLLARLKQESAPVTSAPNKRRRLMIVAVTVAASIAWTYLGWLYFSQPKHTTRYNPIKPLDRIYQNQVAAGFRPLWVCEDDRQFANTFFERQGQALLLAMMPSGSKMEGLTYCGGISMNTTTMLARVDDKPVLVFVDETKFDSHPAKPPRSTGLNLFRKELGPLVLYEVSPLAEPRVMDYLRLTDPPPPQ